MLPFFAAPIATIGVKIFMVFYPLLVVLRWFNPWNEKIRFLCKTIDTFYIPKLVKSDPFYFDSVDTNFQFQLLFKDFIVCLN